MGLERQFDLLKRSLQKAVPFDAVVIPSADDLDRVERQKNEEHVRQVQLDKTIKFLLQNDELTEFMKSRHVSLLLANSSVDGTAWLYPGMVTVQRRTANKHEFDYRLQKKPWGLDGKFTDFTEGGIFMMVNATQEGVTEYRGRSPFYGRVDMWDKKKLMRRRGPLAHEYETGVFKGITAEQTMSAVNLQVENIMAGRKQLEGLL